MEGGKVDSVLDLYIMSLVERCLKTAYELHIHGKISLGSALPALKRLKANGALRPDVSDTGTNKHRQPYLLTAAGRARLRAGEKGLLFQNPPTDIDMILRILDICSLAPVAHIHGFIVRARIDRAKRIKLIHLDPQDDSTGLEYLSSRRNWELVSLRTEIRFLSNLSERFN